MSRRSNPTRNPGAQPAPAVKNVFFPACVRLKIDHLEPLKPIARAVKQSSKYRQIVASARIVGLVEPPTVAKNDSRPGRFFLVDGHLRIEALKSLGVQEVDCMIVPDADTYTYNKRINRLSTVPDREMIARAIELGMSRERLVEVLGLSQSTVRKHMRLLAGICERAASILQHGQCPMLVFKLFRKLEPSRQIEGAEIMRKSNNFSVGLARAIVASTDPDRLVPGTRKIKKTVTVQSLVEVDAQLPEQRISNDVELLEMIRQYVASLLDRKEIVRWLANNQRAYAEGLVQIAEMRMRKSRPVAPRGSSGKVHHP